MIVPNKIGRAADFFMLEAIIFRSDAAFQPIGVLICFFFANLAKKGFSRKAKALNRKDPQRTLRHGLFQNTGLMLGPLI